nr:MAG TPA: hypothetical protein [Caudoviricetes sp.]
MISDTERRCNRLLRRDSVALLRELRKGVGVMTEQKPKARKRAIYLVTDYGGEREDAWERLVIAFADEAAAEECAAKRNERQYDEYGPIWDYYGSYVKGITLVDFGDRQEEK